MRKVVIASQKGGVGKTTTAINLAAAAAAAGGRVLLVDTDPSGSVGAALNLSERKTLAPGWSKHPDFAARLVVDALPGCDILTNDDSWLTWERLQQLLSEIGAPYAPRYQTIVFDSAPFFGGGFEPLLSIGDDLLVVVRTEPLAYRTLPVLLERLQVARRSGHRIALRGVVLTLPPGEEIGCEQERKVRTELGQYALPWTIPYDPAVTRSILKGLPVITFDRGSRAARHYEALAAHLGWSLAPGPANPAAVASGEEVAATSILSDGSIDDIPAESRQHFTPSDDDDDLVTSDEKSVLEVHEAPSEWPDMQPPPAAAGSSHSVARDASATDAATATGDDETVVSTFIPSQSAESETDHTAGAGSDAPPDWPALPSDEPPPIPQGLDAALDEALATAEDDDDDNAPLFSSLMAATQEAEATHDAEATPPEGTFRPAEVAPAISAAPAESIAPTESAVGTSPDAETTFEPPNLPAAEAVAELPQEVSAETLEEANMDWSFLGEADPKPSQAEPTVELKEPWIAEAVEQVVAGDMAGDSEAARESEAASAVETPSAAETPVLAGSTEEPAAPANDDIAPTLAEASAIELEAAPAALEPAGSEAPALNEAPALSEAPAASQPSPGDESLAPIELASPLDDEAQGEPATADEIDAPTMMDALAPLEAPVESMTAPAFAPPVAADLPIAPAASPVDEPAPPPPPALSPTIAEGSELSADFEISDMSGVHGTPSSLETISEAELERGLRESRFEEPPVDMEPKPRSPWSAEGMQASEGMSEEEPSMPLSGVFGGDPTSSEMEASISFGVGETRSEWQPPRPIDPATGQPVEFVRKSFEPEDTNVKRSDSKVSAWGPAPEAPARKPDRPDPIALGSEEEEAESSGGSSEWLLWVMLLVLSVSISAAAIAWTSYPAYFMPVAIGALTMVAVMLVAVVLEMQSRR